MNLNNSNKKCTCVVCDKTVVVKRENMPLIQSANAAGDGFTSFKDFNATIVCNDCWVTVTVTCSECHCTVFIGSRTQAIEAGFTFERVRDTAAFTKCKSCIADDFDDGSTIKLDPIPPESEFTVEVDDA